MKKPTYEYVEREKLYRKRVRDINGKRIALYGATPHELTEKIQEFNEKQEIKAEEAKNN